MRAMAVVATFAAAALSSGCATSSPTTQVDESVIPVQQVPVITAAAARRLILSQKASTWKDPYSIRDAQISAPMACTHKDVVAANPLTGAIQYQAAVGTCLCIEANAKNSYGGYIGMRRTVAVFPPAGGVTFLDGAIKGYDEYCHDFRPFPELNGKGTPTR